MSLEERDRTAEEVNGCLVNFQGNFTKIRHVL
jgi:hypothetical protein